MQNAELHTTKEIRDIIDADSVNTYLQLGWKLISQYVDAYYDPGRQETQHYVLGWMENGDAQRPPEPERGWL